MLLFLNHQGKKIFFNETDPIRYDFSLFGLGAFEKYNRSNL